MDRQRMQLIAGQGQVRVSSVSQSKKKMNAGGMVAPGVEAHAHVWPRHADYGAASRSMPASQQITPVRRHCIIDPSIAGLADYPHYTNKE